MIPPFEHATGYLPPGEHVAGWKEISAVPQNLWVIEEFNRGF